MGVVAEMAERRALVLNPKHPRDPALAEWFGEGRETAAGETVTPTTAMRASAFLAGVRYIAETFASLPAHLYRRGRDPRAKERAVDRPLYNRLHDQPNRWQSSFEWRDMQQHHVMLRGNAYAELVPSTELPPFEIVPLHPDRVTPFWAPSGERAYQYRPPLGTADGRPSRVILQAEMLHVAFMPDDGLVGVSVLKHAKETIGRALAASRYASRLYAGDNMPRGVLTHPKSLSKPVREELREEWEKRHRGATNAKRIAILAEGMKFEPTGMTNEDAQTIEFLNLDVADIARILRIPPHKLGDLTKATFSNIEHQAIEAVVDTIRPWLVRWEQRINLDLLTPAERRQYFAEFLVDGLLRGDTASRWDAYAKGWGIGAFSQNDILESENRPPVEGGDERFVPLNMRPLSQVLAEGGSGRGGNPPAPSPRALPGRKETRSLEHLLRLRDAYRPLFAEAARRTLRREADAIERQFRKMVGARSTRSLTEFDGWVDQYYEGFSDVAGQGVLPVAASYADAVRTPAAEMAGVEPDAVDLGVFAAAYAAAYAVRHIARSKEGLRAALTGDPEAVLNNVDGLLAGWRTDRADRIAAHETVQAGSAFARESWRQVGVTRLTWAAAGGACPLCQSLDGQTVGIEQEFVSAGDLVAGDGVTTLVASKTLHPPLHQGCVCSVVLN